MSGKFYTSVSIIDIHKILEFMLYSLISCFILEIGWRLTYKFLIFYVTILCHDTDNVTERDYLRTEGDPGAAGYTIKEAVALTRSVVCYLFITDVYFSWMQQYIGCLNLQQFGWLHNWILDKIYNISPNICHIFLDSWTKGPCIASPVVFT